MSNRYFILKGCAGLGNRLMTLTWCIEYCLKTKRILFVDWSDGLFAPKGTNAFYECFMLKDVPHITTRLEINNYGDLTTYPKLWGRYPEHGLYDLYVTQPIVFKKPYRLWHRLLKHFTANIIPTQNFRLRQDVVDTLKPCADELVVPFASQYSFQHKANILFGADFVPPFSKDLFKKHVSISPDLFSHIEDYSKQKEIGAQTIGIHIRHTDKIPGVSLNNLLTQLNVLQKKWHNIFLATDSVKILTLIRSQFPSIISHAQTLPETGKWGLHIWPMIHKKDHLLFSLFQDSIVDLMLLTKCGYFLYQGNSSYSIIARELAQEEQIAKDWTTLKDGGLL